MRMYMMHVPKLEDASHTTLCNVGFVEGKLRVITNKVIAGVEPKGVMQ
jgi:hypothetical protein